MELPPYRSPTVQGVLWHVWEKTWQYIKKAGTIILAAAILIWAITNFPAREFSEHEIARFADDFIAGNPQAGEEELAAYLSVTEARSALEYSLAGRIGHFIEPVFRPLGFDWKIAVASVTGFAAKEVIVSTLGILYRVGAEETGESEGQESRPGLRDAIRHDDHMRPLIALVFMFFPLIIPPCFAALAIMKAEIGFKWVAFEIGFLIILGWVFCLLLYQIGSLAGF
jgi:ferrous iron transport protein B